MSDDILAQLSQPIHERVAWLEMFVGILLTKGIPDPEKLKQALKSTTPRATLEEARSALEKAYDRGD